MTQKVVSAAVAEIADNRATIEQETNVKLRTLAEQLVADFAGLIYEEVLPARASFDHLLLTAHERVDGACPLS